MLILGLFAVVIAVYFILYYHAVSPYRIYVLFGKQGSGKSTFMVKRMIKYLHKGWNVYTDMEDCGVPGVRIMNDTFDLAKCAPDQNSVIFLDEAGLTMDNRNFKNFPSGMRDFAALHRHYKCTVWLCSQTYDLDLKWRSRAHRMFLVQNYGRLSLVRPIKRNITLTEATSMGESRVADQLKFEWPFSWKFVWLPNYYRFFNSFVAPPRPPLQYVTIEEKPTEKRKCLHLFKK